jgi:hypothetical protein
VRVEFTRMRDIVESTRRRVKSIRTAAHESYRAAVQSPRTQSLRESFHTWGETRQKTKNMEK